jgi:polyisoprenoid-binding protein YceI
MTTTRFTFDPDRSCVWVNAHSSVHPINTQARGLAGWVDVALLSDGHLDLDAPISGQLEVSVDRLSSGNQLYDRELRRRIDARRYPLIVGQITGVRLTGIPNRYQVAGDLSFHGEVRSFEHEMTIEVRDGPSIELNGQKVFDIREFAMKPPSMLMLRVYPEVEVRVELHGHAPSPSN